MTVLIAVQLSSNTHKLKGCTLRQATCYPVCPQVGLHDWSVRAH